MRYSLSRAALAALIGSFITVAGAQAAVVFTRCGAALETLVKAEDASSSTTSQDFVPVPKAFLKVSIPAGQTRCLKVSFAASAGCLLDGVSEGDGCFVRPLLNGVEIAAPAGTRAFAGLAVSDRTASSHSTEWVIRTGAGTHTISIQGRVGDADTEFRLSNWQLSVEIAR